MKEKTYKYQLVIVLDPKVEEKEKVLKKVSTWLETKEVKIDKKDHLGIKELVYEIEKNTKGDFWVMDLIGVNPLKLSEFNVLLNRETSIIRYLILKV
ncbi:MAG: 30S ribosomal protein S6 [Candidatus Shapirobacteria bacterium]|nr:30S ribosomal protein S6 [Candidatus Shapirobacteria bacterium]